MTDLNACPSSTELRTMVIDACRELTRRGLTHGTSGNVSVRYDEVRFFVSPSGMDYEVLQAEDVPLMDLDGRWFGRRRPSSEWRFHRDIFKSRRDVGAIVHTHSPRATALACTGRGIPAFHYMVAVAGGSDIRCAPYHTFGTQELSAAALAALQDRKACLLANHGVIATGADLAAALAAFDKPWEPRTVAGLNDYDVRVVKALGEFTEHSHPETDELFLVLSGSLVIRLDDAEVTLHPGQLFVVPRGRRH